MIKIILNEMKINKWSYNSGMKNVDLSIWESKTVSQCLLNILSNLFTSPPFTFNAV